MPDFGVNLPSAGRLECYTASIALDYLMADDADQHEIDILWKKILTECDQR
jgi:hypothetical protein